MEVYEAEATLHAAGWFMVEYPAKVDGAMSWTVSCNRHSEHLLARSGNRIDAWQVAVKMAADVDATNPHSELRSCIRSWPSRLHGS